MPLRWDGRTEGLPNGYSDSLTRALRDHDTDQTPDTLVICAAQMRSDARGAQVAGQLVHALIEVATRSGLAQVIAPLRPTAKHRYPLIPINDYVSWKRPDGSPLDPWLRTHLQLGARVIGTAPGFTGVHRIGAPMGRLDRPQLAGQRPVPDPRSVGSATTGPSSRSRNPDRTGHLGPTQMILPVPSAVEAPQKRVDASSSTEARIRKTSLHRTSSRTGFTGRPAQ